LDGFIGPPSLDGGLPSDSSIGFRSLNTYNKMLRPYSNPPQESQDDHVAFRLGNVEIDSKTG
jgi:hypothetical protein